MSPALRELANDSSLPPALPPKRSRSVKPSAATPPPISPKPANIVMQTSIHADHPLITSTPVKAAPEEPVTVIMDKKNDVSTNNVTLVGGIFIMTLL